MRHKIILRIYFLLLAGFLIASSSQAQLKEVPTFALKDLDGHLVNSEKFKGQVLLINFWATWCGPCKMEIPDLVRLQKNYRNKGFTVVSIAVSSGSAKDIQQFARKMKMNYPVLIGDAKVIRQFGNITAVPTTFIIDRKGRIQNKFLGARSYKDFEKYIRPYLVERKTDIP